MIKRAPKPRYSVTQLQKEAFEQMIAGRGISAFQFTRLALVALGDPFRFIIMYMPGPTGYLLRRLYFKRKFRSMGRNVLIDVAVRINGPENVSIGDFIWIDALTTIEGALGSISIGKHVHIGPSVVIGSGGVLEINDYATIGARCKIYSHSEVPIDGKRTSGPMIPWEYKGYRADPVIIEKNVVLGANSVILPGVRISEGAVVGANSVVTKNIPPWTITAGVPLRFIGIRDQITMPDL